MKRIARSLLLSLGATVPAVSAPVMLMTSCSTIWGYSTPIQFGSTLKNGINNPFINFRGSQYLDNNGNNIVDYLQSSYIIDAKASTNYAYSSPVTKWLYDKDSTEAKAQESQLMPLNKWERNTLGWKTSSASEFSNNATFSGSLKNDKYVQWVNNENVIQAANIDFTANIATTIAGYFVGALKYQASQINPDDDTAINIAWGNGAGYDSAPIYTLYKGLHDAKHPEATDYDKRVNELFYEYVFSQANAHVNHKNHGAFLRGSSVNFAYDADKFPIPSYAYEGTKRIDISEATKKLLMGKTATLDTKFCEAGVKGSDVLAYYSSKSEGSQQLSIGDDSSGKTVNVTLKYTDYAFENVPIIVTATNFTQRWVNPTKNDSIHVKDFYLDDVKTVRDSVGTLQDISRYSSHDGNISIKSYTFDTVPLDPTQTPKLQAKVVGTKVDNVDKVDTRIVDKATDKIDGNKFIALTTYGVREFNTDSILYKSEGGSKTETDYLKELVKSWQKVDSSATTESVVSWLRQKNLATLSTTTNIFPAYFLNIYNDLFKKAYVNAKDTTIEEIGYMLDASKIASHTDALLGIFNRTSTEGYKSSAKDLTQDSKNLLSFLTFMFGFQKDSDKTIDFFSDILWPVYYE